VNAADGGVAAAVAGELDRLWDVLHRPDPYVVVEDGATDGTGAAGLLAAGMRCAPALRHLLVEPDPVLRAAQTARVALEPPAELLGPVVPGSEEERVGVPGIGPLCSSLAELPRGLDLAVVFRWGRPGSGIRAWLDSARRVAGDGLAMMIAECVEGGRAAGGSGGVPAEGAGGQPERWRHPLDGFPHLEVVVWGLGWVDRRR
jgi:hypothetical protein